MGFRAGLRRIVPYVVIVVTSFTLAYLVIYIVLARTSPIHATDLARDTASAAAASDSVIAEADTPPPLPSVAADTTALTPENQITPTTVEVPSVMGMSLDDARGVLADRHLAIVVRHDTNSFQPPNTILKQSPAAGQTVLSNSAVMVTASAFPPQTGDSSHSPR